ncbi:MAG TPA: proteasome accessory factor PafA2 family protein, partial [Myxococcota bacterium]|nr:proteasome accessory factor PafA2 family protein [Myxococcota bacterium]
GSFHYEATPHHFEHGLLELASPECRDPFALLACERAKDELVEELADGVTAELARRGWGGRVRIGKNNVDSQGHTFGSHESYWVEDPLSPAERLRLAPLWAALWLATLPALAWLVAAALLAALAAVAAFLLPLVALAPWAIAALLPRRAEAAAAALRRAADALASAPSRLFRFVSEHPGEVARRLAWLEAPLHPLFELHSRLYRRFHFRPIERALTAFLVTRTLYSGAGAVVLDGGPLLRLAQRPPYLRALSRVFTSGDERPLYESRDLFFRPWSAFASRRRLHLLHADANLCEWAQVLRVGATALVLEAIEAEPGADWPALADPLGALRALARDPELAATLELAGGGRRSALALQREYLERVRAALARAPAPPVAWKARVVAMWEETLDALASDPARLADRVDWIAKRSLVEREVRDPADRRALEQRGQEILRDDVALGPEGRRLRELAFRALRADLRYHELGPRGGYRRLRAAGRMQVLASDAAVARARREAPRDTRAARRARAIRDARRAERGGAATWHRVRVGLLDWRFFLDPLRGERAPEA